MQAEVGVLSNQSNENAQLPDTLAGRVAKTPRSQGRLPALSTQAKKARSAFPSGGTGTGPG